MRIISFMFGAGVATALLLLYKSALIEWMIEYPYDMGYSKAYLNAAEIYSHTGYVINRASIYCSSNGEFTIEDFTIDGTGMHGVSAVIMSTGETLIGGGLKITAPNDACIDNHDRER